MTQTPENLESELEHLEPPRREAAVHAHEHLRSDLGSDDTVREVLKTFYDSAIFEPVATFVLAGDSQLAHEASEAFLRVAKKPKELVVAHTFTGVMIERDHDALTAEKHVQSALDSGCDWPLAIDRAAWYSSDRGDAGSAVRLWTSIYGAADPQVRPLLQFTATDNSLGRNEACWCGSGRKFKQCHFGTKREFGVADRVGWMTQKINNYVERAGRAATDDMDAMARAYVGDSDQPEDAVDRALMVEPLIGDVVAHDKGWLRRFIDDRGPLLPRDELELVTSWLDSRREVFEVTAVRPGDGMSVRSLDDGVEVEVGDKTFSRNAKKGNFICSRVVGNGEGHQFIGGMLVLDAGTEHEMKDVIDNGTSEDFLAAAGLAAKR